MSQIIGLAASIVALAALSVAIVHGDMTAKVISESGKAFIGSIKAATFQK